MRDGDSAFARVGQRLSEPGGRAAGSEGRKVRPRGGKRRQVGRRRRLSSQPTAAPTAGHGSEPSWTGRLISSPLGRLWPQQTPPADLSTHATVGDNNGGGRFKPLSFRMVSEAANSQRKVAATDPMPTGVPDLGCGKRRDFIRINSLQMGKRSLRKKPKVHSSRQGEAGSHRGSARLGP